MSFENLTAEEKIAMARSIILLKMPFYGYLLGNFEHTADVEVLSKVKTAAIWINSMGSPTLAYNSDFIAKLTVEETVVILLHELEHLLRLHPIRAREYSFVSRNNLRGINWAMDAVINGYQDEPKIDGMIESSYLMSYCVFLPWGWSDKITFESLVQKFPRISVEEYLKELFQVDNLRLVITEDEKGGKKLSLLGQIKALAGKKKGKRKNSKPSNLYTKMRGHDLGLGITDEQLEQLPVWLVDRLSISLERLDDHELWNDTVGGKQYKIILSTMFDEAYSIYPGSAPANIVETLKQLGESKVDWKRILDNIAGRYLGSQRRTYSRRSRRYQKFGVKGVSRHSRGRLLILVDISGSISRRNIEEFFTEIEIIATDIDIEVVSFDVNHCPIDGQDVYHYQTGDWENITLRGRGGTNFSKIFRWIDMNHSWADCNIVFTDGYSAFPKGYEGLNLIWCLTKTSRAKPPYGDIVVIGDH